MNKEKEYIAFNAENQEEIDLLVRELKTMGHSDENIQIIGEHSHLFFKNPEYKDDKSKTR